MLVRTAQIADAKTIAQYNQAMAMETEHKELSADTLLKGVQEVINNVNRGTYYVVEIEDQVAACLLITYEWSDWRNGNFWWIQSVYVSKSFRRQGVFQKLFAHISKLAKEQQAIGLRLYVEADNQAAQKTYENLLMKATDYQIYELEF